MFHKVWDIKSKKKNKEIIPTLLTNRGVRTQKERKEFLKPTNPEKLRIRDVGIATAEIKKAVSRIKEAKRKNEKIIIYGDYDADGVCATAIMWEAVYSLHRNTLPYIPERFSEGYGLNVEGIRKLKEEDLNLKLIITVDNGIVANEAVKQASELGIDVIITDHHQPGKKKPKASAIIHTTKIGGAAVAWFLAKEIAKVESLELAAIGTLADQIPLIGVNRAIVKYGLAALNKTKRVGLRSMVENCALKIGEIGTYEVGFVLAPRINAMGRLEHAIESLRLLCTKDFTKAKELARKLGRVNQERQKIVDEVTAATLKEVGQRSLGKIIVMTGEYHEGVIGLAAGKLVEEFYRPAIVISKGEKFAKASARSVAGFNIIEAIRSVEYLIVQGGGHPMAAGFTIETAKIEKFEKEINRVSGPLLTDEILERKLKIDLEIGFNQINWDLVEKLIQFEPTGLGNPVPTFATRQVEVIDAGLVGRDGKHLKLKLKEGNSFFNAIAFGFGELLTKITPDTKIDIAYVVEVHTWGGSREIQLKVRDLKIN